VKPGEKASPALSPPQVLAEQTGADKVVSGTYYLAGGELQFLSSITDARSRMLFRSLQPVKGSLADRMDVIEKLRQLVMGAMAADLGYTVGDWVAVRPPSYEIYQEFILGMNAFGSNFAKAIGHLEKAVEFDPGFMPAHIWLARCYQSIGRWDKAVSILELTDQNRDKLTPEMALYVAEQWEEAAALVEKLRSEEPDDIDYLGYGGAIAARRGDREGALKISEELKGIERPFTFGAQTYWRARIAALLGMKEEAVELLRQSFSQGKEYSVFVIMEADLFPLRDYAPFKELMKPKG
jgi:tetratricopeptide (TPR) repeat protein